MKTTFLILFSLVATNLQAQWIKTNYPTDKFITSVVTVGGYFYAGTDQNYVYRSSNAGNSWTVISNGLTTNNIGEMISRSSGSITALFAATDSGIFRSSNNGNLWVSLNNGIVDKLIRTVYKTDSYMFAGADTKNYRSTNNGSFWSEITIGSSNQKTTSLTRYINKIFAIS